MTKHVCFQLRHLEGTFLITERLDRQHKSSDECSARPVFRWFSYSRAKRDGRNQRLLSNFTSLKGIISSKPPTIFCKPRHSPKNNKIHKTQTFIYLSHFEEQTRSKDAAHPPHHLHHSHPHSPHHHPYPQSHTPPLPQSSPPHP